ncbi:hypothetical protein AAG906_008499 [Vitis piasezkii]
MMDLDMTLREDEPPKPTNESIEAMRAHYAKWEISNRISHCCGKRYQTSDNAKAGHFMDELMNMRYDDMKGVQSKLKVGSDIGIDVEHIGVAVLELDSVEKQLGKVIKIVRSDRGGEYYGKHGDVGQQKGPFARYLQDNGIVAQDTMPGSPNEWRKVLLFDCGTRIVESQVAKFLELDVADSIPSQSNERVEPMDLLILGFNKELLLSISLLSK